MRASFRIKAVTLFILSLLCSGVALADTNPIGDDFEFTFDTLSFEDSVSIIQVDGDKLYVTTYTDSVRQWHIVDISHPAVPIIESTYDGYAGIIYGNYAYRSGELHWFYCEDRFGNFKEIFQHETEIYDISVPTSPTLLNTIDFQMYGIIGHLAEGAVAEESLCPDYLEGGYYPCCWLESQVWNLSDPVNPVPSCDIYDISGPSAVLEIEGRVFQASGSGWHALHIYDVSDPCQQVMLDSHSLSSDVRNVHSSSPYVFVETFDDHLATFRLSPSGELTHLGTAVNWPETMLRISVVNGYGIDLSRDRQEITVVDLSDPSEPYEAGGYRFPDSASRSMTVVGNHLLFKEGFSSNLLIATMTVTPCCGRLAEGLTGNVDCSEDGYRDLSDIMRLIDYVYMSKEMLCCRSNGNVDGSADGKRNLSDITRLIDHVYVSTTETAPCR